MLNINIQSQHLDLTDSLKSFVHDKVHQLERHFRKEPINIDVELEHMTTHQSGPVYRCEINIEMPGDKHVLRAESVEEDIYAAIDTCVPKIKQQLDTEREKREDMVKRGGRRLKEMVQRLWERGE